NIDRAATADCETGRQPGTAYEQELTASAPWRVIKADSEHMYPWDPIGAPRYKILARILLQRLRLGHAERGPRLAAIIGEITAVIVRAEQHPVRVTGVYVKRPLESPLRTI